MDDSAVSVNLLKYWNKKSCLLHLCQKHLHHIMITPKFCSSSNYNSSHFVPMDPPDNVCMHGIYQQPPLGVTQALFSLPSAPRLKATHMGPTANKTAWAEGKLLDRQIHNISKHNCYIK